MSIEIPPWMLEKIQKGEAVLFLGAGASRGALGHRGATVPTGEGLRDLLADKFLGGKRKNRPLAEVAELAKTESSLLDVQRYVAELFEPFQPSEFHKKIATFKWHAIVTTNFDLVVERAYSSTPERLQELAILRRDGDGVREKLTDPTAVPFLKIHGCVTLAGDVSPPLVLAYEEYAKHEVGRVRLFKQFADWAREHPVIFCGYELADWNVQVILTRLGDDANSRPHYIFVSPNLDDLAMRYWQSRRFLPFNGTFEQFLQKLDSAIPLHTRKLALAVRRDNLSIAPWISSGVSPSDSLVRYIEQELTHVHKGVASEPLSAQDFYRGRRVTWSVFQDEMDVRRRITDDILLDCFAGVPDRGVKVALLRGHAGSGKSVTLRRVAWEAAQKLDALVFCLNEGAVLRVDLIEELIRVTRTRVAVVVDEAMSFVRELPELVAVAKKRDLPLTLLLGARTNEWNVAGGELRPYVTTEHETRDLSEREIRGLIDRLERFGCLGELKGLASDQRVEHFKKYAQRQLLVALHEATGGKPFEEIVFDEYQNIVPREARTLYLDICTLHRLRAPARAGLVSRIAGITFEFFREQLFRPLEHVVTTRHDLESRDYVYLSRHSLIAEFVFEQAMREPRERAEQLVRIVRHMNVDYTSDKMAFDQMIRGRALAELFADKSLAYLVFAAAEESGASKSYIKHQVAVFELNHPSGSLRQALAAVSEAESLSPLPDRTVRHTRAVVLRRLAIESESAVERARLRSEAKALLLRQLDSARESHPHHTYAQLLIDEIAERLVAPEETSDDVPEDAQARAVSDAIREAEQALFRGLQLFPADEHLRVLEARLAQVLQNEPRGRRALERAFALAPGRGFIAVRLAENYRANGEMKLARETLEKCLQVNPSSKEAHLSLGRLYMQMGERDHASAIGYHLKRSFTQGDSNYDARFWFARHQFIHGNRNEGHEEFDRLSETRMAPELATRVRGKILDGDGHVRRFEGVVRTLHADYCFVGCLELGVDVFLHVSEVPNGEWDRVARGSRLSFEIGFNMRGPYATSAQLF